MNSFMSYFCHLTVGMYHVKFLIWKTSVAKEVQGYISKLNAEKIDRLRQLNFPSTETAGRNRKISGCHTKGYACLMREKTHPKPTRKWRNHSKQSNKITRNQIKRSEKRAVSPSILIIFIRYSLHLRWSDANTCHFSTSCFILLNNS